MKETLAGVAAAGAILLFPHPTEQPEIAELAPQIEILADSEGPALEQFAQPENSEPAQIDDNHHNLAIGEIFNPDTVQFWFEVGGVGLTLTGFAGFVTSRKLKKSLRKDHASITDSGWGGAYRPGQYPKICKRTGILLA